LDRDLSWIAFNGRVQAQAEDARLPVMDRVRFAAIVGSNLDEFFMVRVALARRGLREGRRPGGDGPPLPDLLDRIDRDIAALFGRMHANFQQSIVPALEREGLTLLRPSRWTEADQAYLREFFAERALPVLTPLTVDPGHPFPLLANGAMHMLLRVRQRADAGAAFYGEADTVLVELPRSVRRFVALPSPPGQWRAVWLADVVSCNASGLMRGYDILGAYPFRILRDSELTVAEAREGGLLAALEEELLRHRHESPAVRLIVGAGTPPEIIDYLARHGRLEARDVVQSPGMLEMRALSGLEDIFPRPDLREPPWPPAPHPAFAGATDVFAVLRERDVLLEHPYQSFDPVVRLVEQAADDPDTLAVKITLYRVSGESPLVRALVRAAERGKQVTALVELRARFDEAANIAWAKRLDAAGAHVIYGVMGYKTHSKACVVIRREPGGLARYCHLGTGNYNDRTARQYTDLGYLTSRPAFGSDLSGFFNVITGYSLPPPWQRIEMAPLGLRARTESLIRREMEKHTPQAPGHIRAKMNSLTDPATIAALYDASRAGVRVDLLVRGTCCLRPGVRGLSETVSVRSIVDRFLEHPRIFHYRNGGADEVYASSADWMERNLDKRIELLFPILDPECRRQALRCLDAGLADNTNAWALDGSGRYARLSPGPGERPFRSQQALYAEAVAAAKDTRPATPDGMFVAQARPGGRDPGNEYNPESPTTRLL